MAPLFLKVGVFFFFVIASSSSFFYYDDDYVDRGRFFYGVRGAIHRYEDAYFFSVGDAFIYRGGREGLFASKEEYYGDDWGVVAPGLANGKSYIRFNKVAFRRSLDSIVENDDVDNVDALGRRGENEGDQEKKEEDEENAVVQAVVFEVNDRDRVGYVTEDGGRRYCCDEALAKTSGCSPGRVIVRPKTELVEEIDPETKKKKMVEVENMDWPWVTDAYFEGPDQLESRTVDDAVSIEETGMYYLWFVICDPKLAGTTVNGQTAWKNPSGYLPGMMAANLPFYLFLSLAYLALGICWAINYAVKWKYLMQIHHAMTFVVSLGMIETCVWYYDYSNFNTTGFRPYFVTIFAVIVSAAWKSVCSMSSSILNLSSIFLLKEKKQKRISIQLYDRLTLDNPPHSKQILSSTRLYFSPNNPPNLRDHSNFRDFGKNNELCGKKRDRECLFFLYLRALPKATFVD